MKYNPSEKYELIIKGNYKIYVNDKYKGLNTKEFKAILDVAKYSPKEVIISGSVYHYKKTFREYQEIGNLIDKFEKCKFILTEDGTISSSENPVFPPLNKVPFFPDKNISVNDIYKNEGNAFLSIFGVDETIRSNILSATKYFGKKEYQGVLYDYFEISYRYEIPKDNPKIKKIRGQHNLSLYFNNKNGKPVFMKDNFIEEIELSDAEKVRQDGFYLYFYKNITPMNKEKAENDIKNELEINKKENNTFTVTKKETGISITINDLKFKPDSKELLPEEKNKLTPLLNTLKKIPDRSFMIIGHTAFYGTKEEQDKLSLERAKTIAEYLIKNNISSEKIFYSGKGAAEPIAPNDNEENMKKNRRVEIIILED